MVHKFKRPLKQVKSYDEFFTFTEVKISLSSNNEIVFKKLHDEGPLVEQNSGPQFKTMIMSYFKINTISSSNCYIGFKSKENKLNIFKIENITKNVLVVKCFDKIEIFFVKPINSLTLGIVVVEHLPSIYKTIINIQEIKLKKYVIFNDSDNVKIVIPILNSNSKF
jgi:hypothetical protein